MFCEHSSLRVGSICDHTHEHCNSCPCSCLPILRCTLHLLLDLCRPARSLLGAGQEPGTVAPLYGWRRRSACWRCWMCCGVAKRTVQLKKDKNAAYWFQSIVSRFSAASETEGSHQQLVKPWRGNQHPLVHSKPQDCHQHHNSKRYDGRKC